MSVMLFVGNATTLATAAVFRRNGVSASRETSDKQLLLQERRGKSISLIYQKALTGIFRFLGVAQQDTIPEITFGEH